MKKINLYLHISFCVFAFTAAYPVWPSYSSLSTHQKTALGTLAAGGMSAVFMYLSGISRHIATFFKNKSGDSVNKAKEMITYLSNNPEAIFIDWHTFTALQKQSMIDEMRWSLQDMHTIIKRENNFVHTTIQRPGFWIGFSSVVIAAIAFYLIHSHNNPSEYRCFP